MAQTKKSFEDIRATMRIQEGEHYTFKIVSQVEIPGSDEVNYIFMGPDERKYLVPTKYYQDYHLEVGNSTRCKVDKINCTGQVFLEPVHPYYQTGTVYTFNLIGVEEVESVFGHKELIAKVSDDAGKMWKCALEPDYKQTAHQQNLECRIVRISKGALFLESPRFSTHNNKLIRGWKYPFLVKEIKEILSERYIILITDFHSPNAPYLTHLDF